MLHQMDDVFASCEEHLFEDLAGMSSVEFMSSDSFPSDDIWKKFELCDFQLNDQSIVPDQDQDFELDAMLEWSLDATNSNEIRHHDCMWAGHCASKEHKPDAVKTRPPLLQLTTVHTTSATTTTTVRKAPPPNAPTNQRSLLLTSRTQNGRTATHTVLVATRPQGPRPDSPPSSDDDDQPRFKHEPAALFEPANKTLQLLNDAISEYEYDSDLYEYFEDGDVCADIDVPKDCGPTASSAPAPAPAANTPPATPRTTFCESDHSYHKGKAAQFRTDHLGVQTPSDSEEEIDVVSIGDKQITNVRSGVTSLPTNPSVRDRQKLQRTVASAISGKREFISHQPTTPTSGGIKTRLPLRLGGPTTPPHAAPPGKKRTSTGDGRRGAKRARYPRYQKSSPGNSPTKRRGYGHSSDSDTECSEKRSLHNNMERQRRVDLRNAFDDLRVLVPEVACKERAAKVVILREAAAYCDQLSNESASYNRQVAELRRQQERLRVRVSQLRRSLAAKR